MKNIVLLLLALFLCKSASTQSISDLRKIFDYDKGENLDYHVLATRDTLQGTIHSVMFSSTNGLKVTANLIIPHQQLRIFPVVIFLNDAAISKEAFLSQALELASNAVASLLVDALPSRPGPFRIVYQNFAEPVKDFNAYRQAVLDVRRCVDLLEQHPQVDRNRIVFIGNGDGAMTGAIVSAVETRINGYILMSCSACYSSNLKNSNHPSMSKARSGMTPEQITRYELVIKPLNPENYLPYHRNSLIFFQFAQNDPYADEPLAKSIIQLTKEPKTYRFYKTTNLGLPLFKDCIDDQQKWLMNHL